MTDEFMTYDDLISEMDDRDDSNDPEFRDHDGYCEHGTYVGGCGIDWMCGWCEDGISAAEAIEIETGLAVRERCGKWRITRKSALTYCYSTRAWEVLRQPTSYRILYQLRVQPSRSLRAALREARQMHNDDYDFEDLCDWSYRHAYGNGYLSQKKALAVTLTRLRGTIDGNGASEDDRAYIRALEHVADAHGIKSETVTTVTYSA